MIDLENIKPPLSNAQHELLQVFAMNLSEEDEKELQTLLSQFLWKRIQTKADKVWKEKGYDISIIEKWLNEENRTEANVAIRKAKAANKEMTEINLLNEEQKKVYDD